MSVSTNDVTDKYNCCQDLSVGTVNDLDDKLIDISESVLPDSTQIEVKNIMESNICDDHDSSTFCHKCRTISSVLLSSGNSILNTSELNLFVSEKTENALRYSANQNSNCSNSTTLPLYSDQYYEQNAYDEEDDDTPLILSDDNAVQHRNPHTNSDHCHAPKLNKHTSKQAITKLLTASVLTAVFMVGEAVGGYLASSIAVMSDAAHLLSDLTSFVVSLTAVYLASRPASKTMSYGYYRAEILGAVISVIIIWVITSVLVYAAIERVVTMDFNVDADTMIIVAAVGVFFNLILGIVLHVNSSHSHVHDHVKENLSQNPQNWSSSMSNHFENINVRAAFIHVLGDLIQSIGVLIAAYIIRYYPEYKVADPICTFVFSVLVIITTVPILRDLSHVLMEGTPAAVDIAAISSDLSALPGVKMVHSLHVWSLTLEKNALSVHLAIGSDCDSEIVLKDAQRIVRSRHHIFHTTIQVEHYQPQLMDSCEQCQPLV